MAGEAIGALESTFRGADRLPLWIQALAQRCLWV